MKLINLKRYHVFKNLCDNKLYLLNETYHKNGIYFFEFHRVYKDGRTNLIGYYTYDKEYIKQIEVIDLGDYMDWLKNNHPIRYNN